jgi:FKBP-type peptidyl-prolyl cis-trans isomerase
MRLIRRFAPIAALALLAACDLSTEPNVPAPIDPADDTYAASLGVDISTMTKTSTGLYFKDKTVGTGTPAATGDSVRVHYTLWLTNGTKVQSSKDGAGRPFEFLTGATPIRVIPGFEEGVIGMQEGGVRQLVIPTHLAWGPAGNNQPGFIAIPPNANVVFEIEYLGRLSIAQ